MQYIQDYDETYPSPTSNPQVGAGGYPWGWAGVIYPYANSKQVFACPDDPTVPGSGDNVLSYALNGNLFPIRSVVSIKGFYVIPASKVLDASDTICLMEIRGGTNILDNHVGVPLSNPNEASSPVAYGANTEVCGAKPKP